jgi:hypothetical protein
LDDSPVEERTAERGSLTMLSESGDRSAAKTRYRWLPIRFWLAMLLYWLTVTVGTRMPARPELAGRFEGIWAILVMLVLLILCMATERSGWSVWQRAGFVCAGWLVQNLCVDLLMLLLGLFLHTAGARMYLDANVNFLASLPAAIFSMRRSRWFVAPRLADH